jgi:hypothetical protein
VPTFNKDKRCMKDTFLPIHKTSYLYEINKNNKDSVTNKKNSDAHFINAFNSRKADFLRQFFPEMAIFTFNTWPVLKGMKNENETL